MRVVGSFLVSESLEVQEVEELWKGMNGRGLWQVVENGMIS